MGSFMGCVLITIVLYAGFCSIEQRLDKIIKRLPGDKAEAGEEG